MDSRQENIIFLSMLISGIAEKRLDRDSAVLWADFFGSITHELERAGFDEFSDTLKIAESLAGRLSRGDETLSRERRKIELAFQNLTELIDLHIFEHALTFRPLAPTEKIRKVFVELTRITGNLTAGFSPPKGQVPIQAPPTPPDLSEASDPWSSLAKITHLRLGSRREGKEP